MDEILRYDYPNPDYPVSVNFWERKKSEGAKSGNKSELFHIHPLRSV